MNAFQQNFIKSYSDLLIDRYRIVPAVALFIACQFALESDYGRSSIAQFNNLCGMRFPSFRPTLAKSKTNGGFAIYDSVDDCIQDYMLRNCIFSPSGKVFTDVKRFSIFIYSSGYCPERDYIKRIENVRDLYLDSLNN